MGGAGGEVSEWGRFGEVEGAAYGADGGEGSEFEDVFDGGFGGVDGGWFDEGCVFDHGGRAEGRVLGHRLRVD